MIKAGNVLGFSLQSIALNVGALRLTDTPLAFPSPYNPGSGNPVVLQYSLSQNSDIDLIIFSFSGQVIKRITVGSGLEGGKAGLNKLSWDGKTDFGTLPGNGVYIATILDGQEHKILGKAKITIYR